MRVKLIQITQNPIDVMWTAARTCYSSKSPVEMWDNIYADMNADDVLTGDSFKSVDDKHWKLVKKVLDSHHDSIAEHVYFTFAIEGISRACYDKDTEVLTKDGWKLFKDINITTDEFVTRNQQNGQVELHKAIDYITYDYEGILHEYSSQNISLSVTPNHSLFIKPFDVRIKHDYKLVPSEEIKFKRFYMTKTFNYTSKVVPTVQINGYSYLRNYKGVYKEKFTDTLNLDKEYFLPLLAWYLSDGSVYYNTKENSACISIAQTQCAKNVMNRTRERIADLISNLGFTAHMNKGAVRFKSLTLGKFFKELGYCNEKYIPFDLFECFNQRYAKMFIDEYLKGDGSIDKNGCGKLYTSSKKLADQLYTLCFMAGYTCKIRVINPRGVHEINGHIVNAKLPSYVINVTLSENGRNREILIKKDKHLTQKYYNDKVYCVTVPNHTLFVRRNGIAVWCGNCSHQLVRHRHCTFSQQSQRYVEIKEDYNDIQSHQVKYNVAEGIEYYKDMKEHYTALKQICDKYFVDVNEDNFRTFANMLVRYLKDIEVGEKPEDARQLLPNATKTNITMSCNLRELIHICNLRLCSRAQTEIRELFKLIKAEVTEQDERLGSLLVSQCESLGYCPEHQCCGKMKTLPESLGQNG